MESLCSPNEHVADRVGVNVATAIEAGANEAVRIVEGEAFLGALIKSSSDAIFTTGLDAHITTWNPGAERIFGYTATEVLGQSPSMLIPDERLAEFDEAVKGLFGGDDVEPFTSVRRRKDGVSVHVSLTFSRITDAAGRFEGVLVIARDVTCDHEQHRQLNAAIARAAEQTALLELRVDERTAELRRSNEELLRSERALAALSGCNRTLVRATDEVQLTKDICDTIVSVGGYRMAWVGSLEHGESRRIVPGAWSGFEDGYLATIGLTWDEEETGQGPGGRSVRERHVVVSRDTQTDPRFVWRKDAVARGFRSTAAFPLMDHQGVPFALLAIYSAEVDAFDEKEITLLEELSADLAFGIGSLRARACQRATEEDLVSSNARLEQMVHQVAEAMGKIVEARDPYTKGHEVRVSRLAEMVAIEMGASPDLVAAVGMASLLHDIGKLRVPTEILSKPGSLSRAEFSLIKEHSRGGYEILCDVSFPWPIADIVLQHHERMDGSGYPEGLSGDAILPAARILAACDVIEAMASYRPYRAALGLSVAMAEVTDHPDEFDPEVVAACVRLYDGGHFAFLDVPEGQ